MRPLWNALALDDDGDDYLVKHTRQTYIHTAAAAAEPSNNHYWMVALLTMTMMDDWPLRFTICADQMTKEQAAKIRNTHTHGRYIPIP